MRDLLDTDGRALQLLDPSWLAIIALVLAVLAQASLTWRPSLLAAWLVVLGSLLVVSSFLGRRTRPGYGLTSILLFAALIGGGLVFHFLSSFQAAIPLYAAAVVLFVLAGSGGTEIHRPDLGRPSWWEIALLLAILAVGLILQGYRVAEIPPGFHGDEAESGLQALQLLKGEVGSLISVGWYHLPMMSFAWPAASMRILGETVYGLRMSSVIVGTLTLIPFYALARLLFGRTTAPVATFLLAVSHPFIALNRLGINYTHTTLFEVVTFYFLFRGLRSGKWWDFAASGLFMGAGLYLYYASRLVPFIVLGFLGYLAVARRELIRDNWRGVMVLWCAAVLIFAPMAVYFVQHPWHFMSRTSFVYALGSQGWVDTPYPRGGTAAVLLGQAARVLPLFNYGGDTSGQYGYRGPMLDFVTSALFVLGLGYATARAYRPRYFFLLLWFWTTLIVGGMLTLPAPFVPRLAGMLPVPCLFAAVAIQRTVDILRHSWIDRRAAQIMLAALVALALSSAAALNYRTYFEDYLPTVQGWAMREPATAIARYANSLGDGWEVYLLGEPKLYIRHGTIRFIARDLQGTDVLDPARYIPLRTTREKNAVFILLPTHLQHLGSLQQYYPRGVVRNFTRPSGELWF
ncbi:MAG: glycosyltransferase family 39 protein, partial [Anaerolineae bacterium]|nr:glycosyltransferase family 39 protein [Anaerolineae bacterium]